MFVLWHDVAAVPDTKTDDLSLSRDIDFCDSICFEGVDKLVSAGLVHLFEIRIALRFLSLTVIRGPECLLNMNLLTLSLNSTSMAFRISPVIAFVIPPDLTHCLMFTQCVSPAPRLVSCDVVIPAPVPPVAMVPSLLDFSIPLCWCPLLAVGSVLRSFPSC